MSQPCFPASPNEVLPSMQSGPESISRYGAFVEGGACFELRAEPPRKWHNMHFCTAEGVDFFSEVSNLGDGPTVVRDAAGAQAQLCGYEHKFVYVRDEESGVAFSPGGAPLPTEVGERSCRYWASQTELRCVHAELAVTQRVFVPACHPVEVWTVTVENRSSRPRRVSVFGYVKFELSGNMLADVEPDMQGVFASVYSSSGPNYLQRAFLVVQQHYHAASGHRDDFLRSEYSVGTPRLFWGADLSNRSGYLFAAMGAVQSKMEIPAGGSVRLDFLFGHARDVAAVGLLRATLTPERIEALAAERMAGELARAERFTIETGHPNVDALMNHFAKKQLHSYLINKNGFRDNLQVTLALAMADPETSRTTLEAALSWQHPDGSAPTLFRPLDNTPRADQPAWILMAVPAWVKETGEFGWLQTVLPYQGGAESGTVWAHMLRAMRYMVRDVRGHGLSDLRCGDWNDGLTPIGQNPPGRESVMVSQQLCHGLLEVAELADHLGETAVAAEAREWHAEFARRINAHCWDGEWYQRVLCDDGFILGTRHAEEGKIFINSQSWAILGRVAPPERASLCMDKLEEHLKLDIGYRLCAPPYTKRDERVGHSSVNMPGDVENGGCYNHAAGFKGVADCMLGRAEQAWETFRKIAPDNPENLVAHSGLEPFSFTNLFFSHRYSYGKAFYPWRTGTAAWFTLLMVEWILGARRSPRGLLIDPCLSKAVPRARVVRHFRGAVFDIRIDNRSGRGKGVRSIHLDGVVHEGTILPDLRSGTHLVEVVL